METHESAANEAKAICPTDMDCQTEIESLKETEESILRRPKSSLEDVENLSGQDEDKNRSVETVTVKDVEMRAQITIKKKRKRRPRKGKNRSIVMNASGITSPSITSDVEESINTSDTLNKNDASTTDLVLNGNEPMNTIEPINTSDSTNASKSVRPSNASKQRKGNKKKALKFAALSAQALQNFNKEMRKIPVPPHRMTPLRTNWMQIYEPVVKHLKLQIRMNLRNKAVELKASKETTDSGALQKGHDFVKAFLLGFAIPDAIALVRLDDLYIETFEVKDIRSTLKGDHLSRAVGRIAGKDGRTKFTIENATKTRIVVADTKIHILGSYENTRLARHSISSLVLGAAPGKVYNKLRTVSARLNEKKF